MLCICLSTLLYLIVFLVPILYFYGIAHIKKRRAKFEASHGLPYHPLPGFTATFLKKLNVEEVKYQTIKKVGKVLGFRFYFQDTILIAEPELIQMVLSKEFTNFTNRRQIALSDPIFKHFISVTNDEVWKRQRAIITPTFATGKLRNMMPRLRITLNTLMGNLDEAIHASGETKSAALDMKKMANAFTMDTIAQTAFGLELDSLKNPNSEMIKYGQMLVGNDLSVMQALKFLTIFSCPRLASWLKLEFNSAVNRYFSDIVRKVLVDKRDLVLRNDFRPTNFIELLLEAELEYEKQLKLNNDDDSNNKKAIKFMSNDEIVAQCVLFFIAGFETTAATISVTLHELAMNPDVQDKLHQEIQAVLSMLRDNARDVEDIMELVAFEDLSKFAYLSAVLDETLRLHSPGPFTERVAANDMKLCTWDGRYELTVLKGDVVHFPVYAIHRDEHNFPEPEVYRPERFLHPVHHNYAYLPFGQGPRNCVAKSFALMEVKLAVLHLVYRYKFSKSQDTKHPVEIFFQSNIHTPKAIPLKIERRF